MLTVACASRLKSYGVTVNACHPGDVNSRLSNDLGLGGQTTPDEGADTPVWLATDPVGQPGKFLMLPTRPKNGILTGLLPKSYPKQTPPGIH